MLDHLQAIGVTVHLRSEVESVAGSIGAYTVALKGGEKLLSTHALVATGKTPRLHGLGLETIGINPKDVEIDEHGAIRGVENVWAVGDVTRVAPFTHGANSQALAVAENIAGGRRSIEAPAMPRCVYTHPPLAAVGRTTDECDEEIVVARVSFDDIARPTTDSLGPGLLTVIADARTGAILGASAFGHSMDEVIGQLSLAIETQWPVQRLRYLVQPFPTVAELVGVAYESLVTSMNEWLDDRSLQSDKQIAS
jgi:pyruvate/2-oxoglutarate dehydrogenase complex dihydrolipoamide dehydrogenase (E3) component